MDILNLKKSHVIECSSAAEWDRVAQFLISKDYKWAGTRTIVEYNKIYRYMVVLSESNLIYKTDTNKNTERVQMSSVTFMNKFSDFAKDLAEMRKIIYKD